MFLFPVLKRKNQVLLRVLWSLAGVSFLGFLVSALGGEVFSWSNVLQYYWFSGMLFFLIAAIAGRSRQKEFEPAGMLGIRNHDVFIKDKSREKKISGDEIEELVFYPEQFEGDDSHKPLPKRFFEWMMAKPSSRAGSKLEIKTREEKLIFLVCFERISHQNLFIGSLEEHPSAIVENKKI